MKPAMKRFSRTMHVPLSSLLVLITTMTLQAPEAHAQADDVPFRRVQAQQEDRFEGIDKGGLYKRWKRAEYWLQDRLNPQGALINHVAANWDALQQLRSTDWNGTVSGNWQRVGPNRVIPAVGETGIGRVNCLAFEDADTWYAGTAGGGLWRTDNGAAGTTDSWIPLTDNLPSLAVSGIVVDQTNPNRLWILTGDGDAGITGSGANTSFRVGESPGIGILMSLDRGATWDTTALTWSRSERNAGFKLLVHPSDPELQLAATTMGLFRTTDGWLTSAQILSGAISDVEFKPGSTSIVYACGYNRLFRSGNGGASFPEITANLVPHDGAGRMAIAVSADAPDRLYLIGCYTTGGMSTFQVSDDSGNSFTETADQTYNLMATDDPTGDTEGQGNYNLALWASPGNANRVLVGGISLYGSVSGGFIWSLVASANGSPPNYLHADIHALETNPFSGTLIAGSDGGVWSSNNNGNTWTDRSFSLTCTQFYDMELHQPFGFLPIVEVSGGTQDNGTLARPTNVYGYFNRIFHSDGFSTYRGGYDGSSYRYIETQNGTIYRADNIDAEGIAGGFTLDITPPGASNAAWHTPYTPNPKEFQSIIAGYDRLYFSNNGGEGWLTLNSSIYGINDPQVTEVAWSAKNGNSVAFYVQDTQSLKSVVTCKTIYLAAINGGDLDSWGNCTEHTLAVATGSNALRVREIAYRPTDENAAVIAISGYDPERKVFLRDSLDQIGVWKNITYNLPNVPANTVLWDADGIYVGMDLGVFYLHEGDSVWVYHSEGLPTAPVTALAINDNLLDGKKIYAATYGRGIWKSDPAPPRRITRWHVKPGGSGSMDGSGWANAFANPQDALDAAVAGDSILIAQGTYLPIKASPIQGVGDPPGRQMSFSSAQPRLRIYGGFQGNESSFAERDPYGLTPTLSGDLGTAGDSTDNAFHVLVLRGNNEGTLIDNVRISGGQANGSAAANRNGGGVYYTDLNEAGGVPALRHVDIHSCYATQRGAGVYVERGGDNADALQWSGLHVHDNRAGAEGAGMAVDLNPAGQQGYLKLTLDSAVFADNLAYSGGGGLWINVRNGSNGGMELRSSNFLRNRLTSVLSNRFGSGMMVDAEDGAMLMDLVDVRFEDNTHARQGGGLFIDASGDAYVQQTYEQVVFEGNDAYDGGGMKVSAGNASSRTNAFFKDCSFIDNQANTNGGAIHYFSPNGETGWLTFNNSTFTTNSASNGAALYLNCSNGGTAELEIDSCSFFYQDADEGAVFILGTSTGMLDVEVDHSVFFANRANQDGGVFNLELGSAVVPSFVVRNSVFSDSKSQFQGGAFYGIGSNADNLTLRFEHTDFMRNRSSQSGGSIYLRDINLEIFDGHFDGDSALLGGGSICMLPASSSRQYRVELQGTVFENGFAGRDGAALFTGSNFGGSYIDGVVEHCSFSDGYAEYGGALSVDMRSGGQWAFTDCVFERNQSIEQGGGLYWNSYSTLSDTMLLALTRVRFSENFSNEEGGGLYVFSGTPLRLSAIDLTVQENEATGDGGGIYLKAGGGDSLNATFRDFALLGNRSTTAGGGGAFFDVSTSSSSLYATIYNGVFAQNEAQYGGAIATSTSNISNLRLVAECQFCTGVGNKALAGGGGFARLQTGTSNLNRLELHNSLLLDNTAFAGPPQVELQGTAQAEAAYAVIEDGLPMGMTATGPVANLEALLVHPTDPEGTDQTIGGGDDGLIPALNSPIENTADPAIAAAYDMRGLPRSPGTAEVGAYESGSTLCFNDQAPQDPSSVVLPGSVQLYWQPVPNSQGCRVQGRPLGAPGFAYLPKVGLNLGQAKVPGSALTPGLSYEWQVRCACSFSPLSLTPPSVPDTFSIPTARAGQSRGTAQLWPNPAKRQFQVRFAGFPAGKQRVHMELLARDGRHLKSWRMEFHGPTDQVELDPGQQPVGQYLLHIQTGTFEETLDLMLTEQVLR